ncbi:MAG: hypothetical protein Q8Q52_06850 [Acidimicrobiia bacterium]|nr:hypothetical protein [Acidimicrobiia bacterium]
MTPEEEASTAALEAAERFFMSVLYGDRQALWAMFSTAARQFIIRRGVERGLDPGLGASVSAGQTEGEAAAAFLSDLLAGIRKDLEHVDLSDLAFDSIAEPHAPLQVRVTYLQTLGAATGPAIPAFPAGSLVMILESDQWKVERLVPRPG